jgi:hypothetical protein
MDAWLTFLTEQVIKSSGHNIDRWADDSSSGDCPFGLRPDRTSSISRVRNAAGYRGRYHGM